MRAVLNLAAALILVTLQPLAAQGGTPAEVRAAGQVRTPAIGAEATARGKEQAALNPTEKEAAQARTRLETRERDWDNKMKRTMRSICSGARGC